MTRIVIFILLLLRGWAGATDSLWTDSVRVPELPETNRRAWIVYYIWFADEVQVDTGVIQQYEMNPAGPGNWIGGIVGVDSLATVWRAEVVLLIVPGDVTGDGRFNVADLTQMVAMLFQGGSF